MKKRLIQISTYFMKNVRLFFNQKDWKLIIFAAVISMLICAVVGEKMFTTYDSTQSGFFTIISAAIWIGIFNSIQTICKEHATIRSEYRDGLHISSYIIAHVLFDLCVCIIQTAVLLAVCYFYIDFPQNGIIFDNAVFEYYISLLLVIWGSDIMGIMISSISSNPNVAMTVMPFVLILQLIMSGVLFGLSGISEKIAYITYSKWGMSALGSIGNLNDASLPLALSRVFPNVVRLSFDSEYDFTATNLYTAWGNCLIISFAFIIISIMSIKIRNRGS